MQGRWTTSTFLTEPSEVIWAEDWKTLVEDIYVGIGLCFLLGQGPGKRV